MIPWRSTVFARSTAFRLAAAMAILFVVSVLVAIIAANWLVSKDLNARVRNQIEREARALAAIFDIEGKASLIERLNSRSFAVADDDLYYFVSANAGQSAGNVIVKRVFTGWRELSENDLTHVPGGGDVGEAYLTFGITTGDGTLFVGRSLDSVKETQEIFYASALWGLGIALALTIAGTAIVASRAEARIAGIAAALDAVALGQLDRRAPIGASTQDDIGRIAASINEMLDRLADNVASLKQVSADIAHDLKTPIQRLRGTLESVQGTDSTDAQIATVIENAIEQTDQIVQTFQALLRIAQIEGGSPRSRFRPTDMIELGLAISDAFQPAMEEAGHHFAAKIDADRPLAVHGDRDLLAQMLSNLLTNAIRHAPAPADIQLSIAADDGQAILTLADSGPGIPVAERERVFRRLYRLERSRTTEGSGLGLSLVGAIVELHHGQIRLEDNDPGLRVVVSLPRRPE